MKCTARAFTLIECLVYLGLFSICIEALCTSFTAIQESVERAETEAAFADTYLLLTASPQSGSASISSQDHVQIVNSVSTQVSLPFSTLQTHVVTLSGITAGGKVRTRAFTQFLLPL